MQKQMTGLHMEKIRNGGHYSKARDITPENVHLMEQAWVHRSGDYQSGANTRGKS